MTETCDTCGTPLAAYEAFRVLEEGTFCGRCWAERLSVQSRRNVRHIEIAPVLLTDRDGGAHEFFFRFNPRAQSLRASELDEHDREVGYSFRVMAEEGEDGLRLLGRLMDGVLAGLAERQLETRGSAGLQIAGMRVEGRIRWDPETEGSVPRVSIDGREVSWDEFGHMLMTFEGFSFQLQIVDD